jgi:uncharacterized coiled-coil DUF342 family protein
MLFKRGECLDLGLPFFLLLRFPSRRAVAHPAFQGLSPEGLSPLRPALKIFAHTAQYMLCIRFHGNIDANIKWRICMEKGGKIGVILLSASLFFLGLSIFYFSFKVSQIHGQIPQLLAQVESTSQRIEPVVLEVAQIREQVPDIIKEVEQVRITVDKAIAEVEAYRAIIPEITAEAGRIREQIPPVLEEVEATRKMILAIAPPDPERKKKPKASMPEILAEVRQVRETVPKILAESRAIREDAPKVIASLDKASDAVQAASKEMRETRPLVPGILEEVKTTREALPDLLDQAEAITQNARQVGEEAGQGAVGGMITGVLTSPLRLMESMGSTFTGWIWPDELKALTEEDKRLLAQKSAEIVDKDKIGTLRTWKNAKSGNHGTIKLLAKADENGKECRLLEFKGEVGGEKQNLILRLCKDEKGAWSVSET